MRYYFIDEDQELVVDLVSVKNIDATTLEFECVGKIKEKMIHKTLFFRDENHSCFISWDKISWKKVARPNKLHDLLHVNRHLKTFRGFKPSGASSGEEGDLKSQMPGKVVKVQVGKGQGIQRGQTLAILEAMKMENEIKAPFDGKVKEVYITEGQTIESGHVLMELEQQSKKGS